MNDSDRHVSDLRKSFSEARRAERARKRERRTEQMKRTKEFAYAYAFRVLWSILDSDKALNLSEILLLVDHEDRYRPFTKIQPGQLGYYLDGRVFLGTEQDNLEINRWYFDLILRCLGVRSIGYMSVKTVSVPTQIMYCVMAPLYMATAPLWDTDNMIEAIPLPILPLLFVVTFAMWAMLWVISSL